MAADEDAWNEGETKPEPERARIADLTEREMEVLLLVVEGKVNSQIAWAMQITQHTVKAHVASILHKLGVSGRTEAAVMWVREQYRVRGEE